MINRRLLLGGAAAVLGARFSLPGTAQAAGDPLNVFAHRVMKTVATGTQGGDITEEWHKASGLDVNWTTFDTDPLADRLFREAGLSDSVVDVGFILNTQVVPRVASLFEPLDAYMAKDPIETPADVFPGLMSGMSVGGKQVGIPFRHASSGMHYNEELLAERGFKNPPATIEEMIEMARACSYKRADGTQVTGLVLPGLTYPNVIDLARAWDGDFITMDYKIAASQPPMIKALTTLRELYTAGAFPRGFSTITTEDVSTWMQTGRAAFCLQSMGRNKLFNDPTKSKFPGKIKTIAVPISATLKSKYDVAPAKVEFWGMAIPRNAKRKDLSWSFIKAMVTKKSTIGAALNGNGPVRNSTYDDPNFTASVPYAEQERRVLKVARVPIPAFDNAARAGDVFQEEAEAAVLGMKTPEAAMASLVQRVTPLLPKA